MRPSIYGLYDQAGCLRYIGKANDPKARLASHMRDSRCRKTPIYDWIRKHGKPDMRILESDCEDWKASERKLIEQARKRGDRLLNVADGGDEPACSLETRKANGARLQSHPNTIAQRSANGFAVSRKLHADPKAKRVWELKRAIGTALRAGYLTECTKAKLRWAGWNAPHIFGDWMFIDHNHSGFVEKV